MRRWARTFRAFQGAQALSLRTTPPYQSHVLPTGASNLRFLILLSLLTIIQHRVPVIPSAQARAKIKLEPEVLQTQLEQLVEVGVELQQALHAGTEEVVASKFAILQDEANQLIQAAGLRPESSTHLVKLLTNLEGSVRGAQKNSQEQRLKFIKEVFKSLVELVRSYQINNPPKVFFCSQDKSEWIQRGWKPQNPIDKANYPKCGMPAG